MGFDLIGHAPSSGQGEYYNQSNVGWHPLAEYIHKIAPDIAKHCTHWHTNDGDGLNAQNAMVLAERLEAEITSGRCQRYAQISASEAEMAPDEPCWLCDGTGRRKPYKLGSGESPQIGAGDLLTGEYCNACDGKGTVRPDWTDYRLNVTKVQTFVQFLRACGGFSIW
jgi:hypothetical protein